MHVMRRQVVSSLVSANDALVVDFTQQYAKRCETHRHTRLGLHETTTVWSDSGWLVQGRANASQRHYCPSRYGRLLRQCCRSGVQRAFQSDVVTIEEGFPQTYTIVSLAPQQLYALHLSICSSCLLLAVAEVASRSAATSVRVIDQLKRHNLVTSWVCCGVEFCLITGSWPTRTCGPLAGGHGHTCVDVRVSGVDNRLCSECTVLHGLRRTRSVPSEVLL